MATHTRPEPLLTRAKITATISGLVSLLVTLGLIPATVGADISKTADAVIAAVVLIMATVPTVAHAISSRKVVTPSADPRNDDGDRLVPAGSAPVVLDAATALAEADTIRPADGPAGEVDAA
jgi:hypothetical protein